MAMTKVQQAYALSRLEEIFTRHCEEIKKEFTTPAKSLTSQEKLNLISDGEVNTLPADKLSTYVRLVDAFDFSAYTSPEFTSPEGVKKLQQIQTKYKEVSDQIMLGDAVEALGLLQSF